MVADGLLLLRSDWNNPKLLFWNLWNQLKSCYRQVIARIRVTAIAMIYNTTEIPPTSRYWLALPIDRNLQAHGFRRFPLVWGTTSWRPSYGNDTKRSIKNPIATLHCNQHKKTRMLIHAPSWDDGGYSFCFNLFYRARFPARLLCQFRSYPNSTDFVRDQLCVDCMNATNKIARRSTSLKKYNGHYKKYVTELGRKPWCKFQK